MGPKYTYRHNRTNLSVSVQYEQLAEYTINSACRIRAGMLFNIMQALHRFDVGAGRPDLTWGHNYWFPLWNIAMCSMPNRLTYKDDPKWKILDIAEASNHGVREINFKEHDWPNDETKLEDRVGAYTREHKGSVLGLIPVRTFSEGQLDSNHFTENLWVICSIPYRDTFVFFDKNPPRIEHRIRANSRYRHTPILPESVELVSLAIINKSTGPRATEWSIIPRRCSEVISEHKYQSPEKTVFRQHLRGFNFANVRITKIGDVDSPENVWIPDAEIYADIVENIERASFDVLAFFSGLAYQEHSRPATPDQDTTPEDTHNIGTP